MLRKRHEDVVWKCAGRQVSREAGTHPLERYYGVPGPWDPGRPGSFLMASRRILVSLQEQWALDPSKSGEAWRVAGKKNGTSSQSTRGETKVAILTLPMVERSIYEFLRPSELIEIQGRRVGETVLR